MTLHREGFTIIAMTLGFALGLFFMNLHWFSDIAILFWLINAFILVMTFLVVQFFRVPKRLVKEDENSIISPADGKVVAIEEVHESEYFNGPAIQISIFMSPLNVHANWYPIGGEVTYAKYHPGKFLVAWHPKSSTENERTTIVVKHPNGKEILTRQIAGAVARRIVMYSKVGDQTEIGDELGFIKFGSRLDVLVPVESTIQVKLDEKVIGQQSLLAHF